MFQYAFGRTLADKNNVELKLDISFFKGDFDEDVTPREYQLDNFNIRGDILNDNVNNLLNKNSNFLLKNFNKAFQKLLPYYKKRHVKQVYKQFDKNLLKVKSPVFLEGYWQSDKYFYDNITKIKKDFSFKNEPNNNNKRILDNIKKSEAVCIHIRRGDYVDKKVVSDVFENCSIDHYYNAMKFITCKLNTVNSVNIIYSNIVLTFL